MAKQRASDLFSKPQLSLPSEALADAPSQADLETVGRKLADSFVMPPFSVLDARQGVWQSRKRAYLSLGIQSELGRGQQITYATNGGGEITTENLEVYRHQNGGRNNGRSDYGTAYSPNFGAHKNDELGNFRNTAPGANGGNPRPEPAHYKNAAPGGQPRPATKRGPDGHTVRGDGAGKPLNADAKTYHPPWNATDQFERENKAADAKTYNTGGPGDLGAELKARPGALPGSPGDSRPGRDPGKYEGGHAWLGASGMGAPTGRGNNLVYNTSEWVKDLRGEDFTGLASGSSGTSIFDPVLTELMYRWFCPADGIILDPYAGGSVRGIVAALWGRSYAGIDLREEQVVANYVQKEAIVPNARLVWKVGDSLDMDSIVGGAMFDFSLACPPYYNLEQYSYDPKDLSNMASYGEFLETYREITRLAVRHLRPNRFAAVVVGNFRDEKGRMIDFVGDTIRAYEAAGMSFYNECVLLTAIGSLPIRVRNQFRATRKIGKTHQQALVFIKGDPRKAAEACRLPKEEEEYERTSAEIPVGDGRPSEA